MDKKKRKAKRRKINRQGKKLFREINNGNE